MRIIIRLHIRQLPMKIGFDGIERAQAIFCEVLRTIELSTPGLFSLQRELCCGEKIADAFGIYPFSARANLQPALRTIR